MLLSWQKQRADGEEGGAREMFGGLVKLLVMQLLTIDGFGGAVQSRGAMSYRL